MNSGIANADLVSRLLVNAVRSWVNICTRYASRSFSFCYALWRAVLQRFARKFRKQNLSNFPPRTIATGRGRIAASSLPLRLTGLGNGQDDVPIPLQSIQTTERESTSTWGPLQSCLRDSGTSSDQPRETARVSTILSDQQIVASPIQERRPTITFDEPGETTSPTDFRAENARQWSLVPFVPDDSGRYDREIDIPSEPEHPEALHIAPLRKPCPKTLCDHDCSWTAHQQAEGQLYFSKLSNIETRSGPLRLYTEAHLHEEQVCKEVNHLVRLLEERLRSQSGPSLTYTEAVLEIPVTLEGDKLKCCYYLVDPFNRTVGWLEWFDGTDIGLYIGGIPSAEYLYHFFEKQYWVHVERFPHFQDLDDAVFDEIVGLTLYAGIDSSTSRDSTSASHYSADELQQILAFAKNLRSLVKSTHLMDAGSESYLRACVISSVARTHGIFAHNRYFHLTGHHGARLTYDQSVRGKKKKKRTLLIKIMSPLLFQAADRRLADLQKLWTDEIISKVPWKTFIEGMMRDWEQFVINAAVLLNANVAFLDLPGIAPSQSDNGSPSSSLSIAQVASQLSMVTSIGSMVTGLLLVRQHRTKPVETAHDAASYLSNHSSSIGLETLAIEFSLPYALLMWGMLTFLLAIAFACFGPFGFEVTVPQYVLLGFAWAFTIALIVWTVVINLETTTSFKFPDFTDLFICFKLPKLYTTQNSVTRQPEEDARSRPTRRLPLRAFTIGRRRVTLPEEVDNA